MGMGKKRAKKTYGPTIPEYERAKTGRLVPCPGEAHKNPFIDHCGYCAPDWGQIEELAPVDLEAAEKAGLAVSVNDLSPEQGRALEATGKVSLGWQERTYKWGSRSYCVYVWTQVKAGAL